MPDLHPAVVHFPIALLTLYSLFELASIRRLQEKQYWFYVKSIFVILGTLGAVAAYITGLLAFENFYESTLVQLHARFAIATIILFGLAALLYSLAWFGGPKALLFASRFLFNRGAMIPIALAGLIIIYITGGLGGAIVYGLESNPIMQPIYEYFNLK
jgi:uncharacterized membrane protein